MIDEYQERAMSFRLPSANALYAFLNLAAGAGEVCSLVAKQIRDSNMSTDEYTSNLTKELGDVMWMVAAIASDHNLLMSDICNKNINKLEARVQRGSISGSGDNR